MLKSVLFLGYSAAVGELWGLLEQCSGCGALFVKVWLAEAESLWPPEAWMMGLCCFFCFLG